MESREQTLLVLRAQSGDVDAFDQLLRRFQEPLFRCVRNITCDHEMAEDVLQDVFVILYQKLMWLREPAFFKAWAYRIASREALRRVQRERRRATVHDDELLESVPDPHEPDAERRQLRMKLPDLVDQVSPRSRAVLVLYYLEGLSLPEVADVLEVSLGTVKSRLSYGLRALRQQIGEAPSTG